MLRYFTGEKLLPWRRTFLRKFGHLVLPPPDSGLPTPDDIDFPTAVETYVAGLHPLLRLGMMGLFDGINLAAIFFGYLVPMTWLSPKRAKRFLTRLENHPAYLVRNLFVACKALAMTVYYADPRVESATGYSDECLVPPPARDKEVAA